MKAKDIHEMTVEEIRKKLIESEEELIQLRMQLAAKQLENPMKIRHSRRAVARLKAILKQKEAKASSGGENRG